MKQAKSHHCSKHASICFSRTWSNPEAVNSPLIALTLIILFLLTFTIKTSGSAARMGHCRRCWSHFGPCFACLGLVPGLWRPRFSILIGGRSWRLLCSLLSGLRWWRLKVLQLHLRKVLTDKDWTSRRPLTCLPCQINPEVLMPHYHLELAAASTNSQLAAASGTLCQTLSLWHASDNQGPPTPAQWQHHRISSSSTWIRDSMDKPIGLDIELWNEFAQLWHIQTSFSLLFVHHLCPLRIEKCIGICYRKSTKQRRRRAAPSRGWWSGGHLLKLFVNGILLKWAASRRLPHLSSWPSWSEVSEEMTLESGDN